MDFIKKLFKKAKKVEHGLVNVITSDNVEHYRWCRMDDLSIAKLNAVMAWKDDELPFGKFAQIDRCAADDPEHRYEMNQRELAVENGEGELICVHGFNHQPHYLWSTTPLDVLCTGFKHLFRSDHAELKDVVTIRLVNVGATFCYRGLFYQLMRREKDNALEVKPLNLT